MKTATTKTYMIHSISFWDCDKSATQPISSSIMPKRVCNTLDEVSDFIRKTYDNIVFTKITNDYKVNTYKVAKVEYTVKETSLIESIHHTASKFISREIEL